MAALAGLLAGPAAASNQFTLDTDPDSFGAIVTDASGNAYITWNHTANPTDVPTFCKLAPGAHHCTYRVALSVPGAPSNEAASLQPFPILLPNGVVLVVASRSIEGDTLYWTSTNGGQSFGAPYDIPYITSSDCPTYCNGSYPYTGLDNVDDLVAVNWTNSDLYDQGKPTGLLPGSETASGVPAVWWLQSSWNIGLGFNDSGNNIAGCGGQGACEFTFDNPGTSVAGSTIGASGFGSASRGAPSDWVEAYWTETTPFSLDYYYYSPPSAFADQGAWSGPHSVGLGYEPRLAGGSSGLFLLSVDSPSGAGDPGVVALRKYDPASHAFGSPLTLVHESSPSTYLFDGGGLGENLETGELAAVWPHIGGGAPDALKLYLSSDGGRHFSAAQEIATAPAFGIGDNARVAIANHGTGFVTFRDNRGLQVADLYPSNAEYATLVSTTLAHSVQVVDVPVTCPAPKGDCTGEVSLAHPHGSQGGIVASQHFSVTAGTTTVRIRLNRTGDGLLAAGRGRFGATLTIVLHQTGAANHTITAPVTVKHKG